MSDAYMVRRMWEIVKKHNNGYAAEDIYSDVGELASDLHVASMVNKLPYVKVLLFRLIKTSGAVERYRIALRCLHALGQGASHFEAVLGALDKHSRKNLAKLEMAGLLNAKTLDESMTYLTIIRETLEGTL